MEAILNDWLSHIHEELCEIHTVLEKGKPADPEECACKCEQPKSERYTLTVEYTSGKQDSINFNDALPYGPTSIEIDPLTKDAVIVVGGAPRMKIADFRRVKKIEITRLL